MKEILSSIRRTPYQTLTTLFVLFFSSFIIISLLFTLLFFTAILIKIETFPQVTIYFKPDTPPELIADLKESITNRFQVERITYISQQQALEIYRQIFQNQQNITDVVTKDMLPPSLEIQAKNPDDLYKIAQFARDKKGVDEVDFQQNIVDRLLNITRFLRKFSLATAVVLFITTLIILISVISFKISLKKEMIETQKLIGASDFFILKPFLSENLFIASVSSILSASILTSSLFYLSSFITNFFLPFGELTLSYYNIQIKIWPLSIDIIALIFSVSMLFAFTAASLATIIATKKHYS